jgi:hypothetical protein
MWAMWRNSMSTSFSVFPGWELIHFVVVKTGIRALEGLKPGLSSKMREAGAGVRHLTALTRLQDQPEREIAREMSPEKLFMIPWKLAAEILAEEIPDSTAVHWQHSFLDYEPVEVIKLYLLT